MDVVRIPKADYDELREENARLRAALEQIAEHPSTYEQARRIAHDALKGLT